MTTRIMRYFPLLALMLLFSCNQSATKDTQSTEGKNTEEIGYKKEKMGQIVFFGNSLTAGYGLDSQDQAFPSLIQSKIDSLGLPYRCVNAGLSGETSAGGKDRIDWILQQPMDIFVLELGANDGLRGIPTESTYENLSAIVEKVITAYPDCKLVLAGMKIPPSMGQDYFREFEAIFPRLAKQYKMELIPFLLENIAGITELNQGDAVHPTAEGQQIMAENVWNVLEGML